MLQSHHFQSREELEATLHRFVWLYNQQLPQSALASKTHLQAMMDWHKLNPSLLKKQPYSRPGFDNYPPKVESVNFTVPLIYSASEMIIFSTSVDPAPR